MKSKKHKKGGTNTNPLFTGLDINNINKVLELFFLMLVVWIILFLFIIGPTRLFKMFKRVNQNILEYIGIIVEGDPELGEIVGEQELDQIEVVGTPPSSPRNNLTYRTPPRDSSNYDD